MRLAIQVSLAVLLASGCEEDDAVSGDEGSAAEAPADAPAAYGEDARVIDFGAARENRWYAVNDTVMGGVSDGQVDFTDEELVFEGVVSTDSNGGFTSVRSPDETMNLRSYDRVLVRMRSEGQPFSMILATSPYWFEDQYRYDIGPTGDGWTVVEIPLDDFEVYTSRSGYPTPTGEMMRPRDRTEVLHLEFMSKLFEDGPFRLEVDYVAFD